MVIASHGVFATYGFWPPNDPRGSWSDRVWADHLKRFGDAKKVTTRTSIAHMPFDRSLRRKIDGALRYPNVNLDEEDRSLAAAAIRATVESLKLKVYALAVLPDHVHFVAARHREDVETLTGFLKRAAVRELTKAGRHPFESFRDEAGETHSMWVRGGWKRYLNKPAEIAGAIHYVRNNPIRAGLPAQQFDFETAFVWHRSSRSRDG